MYSVQGGFEPKAQPTKNGLGWSLIQLICRNGNVGQHFDSLRKQIYD